MSESPRLVMNPQRIITCSNPLWGERFSVSQLIVLVFTAYNFIVLINCYYSDF